MVAAKGDRPTPTKKRKAKDRKKENIKPETASGYFEKLVLLKGKIEKSQVESQTEEIERKEN